MELLKFLPRPGDPFRLLVVHMIIEACTNDEQQYEQHSCAS